MDKILQEGIFVALVALFSLIFYLSVQNPVLYAAFIVASLAFAYVDESEDFGIAAAAFVVSLFILQHGYVQVTASIGVVFFSLGLYKHIWGRG